MKKRNVNFGKFQAWPNHWWNSLISTQNPATHQWQAHSAFSASGKRICSEKHNLGKGQPDVATQRFGRQCPSSHGWIAVVRRPWLRILTTEIRSWKNWMWRERFGRSWYDFIHSVLPLVVRQDWYRVSSSPWSQKDCGATKCTYEGSSTWPMQHESTWSSWKI